MGKKIVIISNYFPPEMGAAANRIKNLADGLKNAGNDIVVICPLPNYPEGKILKSYKGKFFISEEIDGIKVKRYWIFPSTSKKTILRLISMLSFSWSLWFSFFYFLRKRPDLIVIQSPPLLVAFSGLLFSKLLRIKTILNVSDIWPLSALELGVIKKGVFYSFLEKIEHFNYRLAHKIMGQSEEIVTHVSKLVSKEFLIYRNVPIYKRYSVKEKKEGNLRIVYAGLLGYAQGILKVCKEVNFKELGVEFHIYGAGMEEEEIKKITRDKNNNIFFHGAKSPLKIKEEIRKYDIGFVPLKNRIYGAVPSKIFELIQLGVPVLYTCTGEALKIVKQNDIGFVSENNNSISLSKTILKFKNLKAEEYTKMSENCLRKHAEEYRLDCQLKKMVEYIGF